MEDPKPNPGQRRAELARKAGATIGDKASDLWWTFLVRGGIALLAGVALLGLAGGTVPRPDLATAPALLRALHAAMRAGHVASAHDLSEGGLAVAAAEMAFAGELGARLELSRVPCEDAGSTYDGDATRLFSESCTRFLVEVAPEHADAFEALFADLPLGRLGEVTGDATLRITGVAGDALLVVPIEELRQAFHSGFQG